MFMYLHSIIINKNKTENNRRGHKYNRYSYNKVGSSWPTVRKISHPPIYHYSSLHQIYSNERPGPLRKLP